MVKWSEINKIFKKNNCVDSLYLFSQSNEFRILCMKLINKKAFDKFQPKGLIDIKTEEIATKIIEKTKEINEEIKKVNDNLNQSIIKAKNQLRLDLLFIIDITNSMDMHLENIKKLLSWSSCSNCFI